MQGIQEDSLGTEEKRSNLNAQLKSNHQSCSYEFESNRAPDVEIRKSDEIATPATTSITSTPHTYRLQLHFSLLFPQLLHSEGNLCLVSQILERDILRRVRGRIVYIAPAIEVTRKKNGEF
jgi:hypothetical protein